MYAKSFIAASAKLAGAVVLALALSPAPASATEWLTGNVCAAACSVKSFLVAGANYGSVPNHLRWTVFDNDGTKIATNGVIPNGSIDVAKVPPGGTGFYCVNVDTDLDNLASANWRFDARDSDVMPGLTAFSEENCTGTFPFSLLAGNMVQR